MTILTGWVRTDPAVEEPAVVAPTRTRPSREEVWDKIIAELAARGVRCDTALAEDVIALVRDADAAYTKRRRAHTLTARQMDIVHPLVEIIMPDKQRSRPGTAHRALEEHLLDEGLGVEHTRNRQDDCIMRVRRYSRPVT